MMYKTGRKAASFEHKAKRGTEQCRTSKKDKAAYRLGERRQQEPKATKS
jgi:hypothetical protein